MNSHQRIVYRHLYAGTLQAPPRMVQAITEWAVKNILLQLWVDQREYPSRYVSTEVSEELQNYARKANVRPRLEREFRISLKDWPYLKAYRDFSNKHPYLSLGVSIEQLESGTGAEYHEDDMLVKIGLPDPTDLPKSNVVQWVTDTVSKSVRHELQHFAQTILERAGELTPGLLSKGQRTPENEETGWGGDYYLTDREFQPNLEDAKSGLQENLQQHPELNPRDIFDAMVGLKDPLPGIDTNPLFKALRSNPTGKIKYQRALKELGAHLVSLTSKGRVATRFLLSL